MLFLSKNLFGKSILKKYMIISSHIIRQKLHAELQKQRGIIQVQGGEASDFLQGLVTNDVQHLDEGAKSMYAMLLNTKGRTLFDSIIYKKADNKYFIDCDVTRIDMLIKHLKMYKVRRNVNIESVSSDYVVWSVFDPNINFGDITPMDMDSLYMNPKSESEVILKLSKNVNDDTVITRDPRLRYLGHRVISHVLTKIQDIIPEAEICENLFKNFRYRLGICEGDNEIPANKCLPLETNCDYMHGVSFHKGCYIGQELTARTYHTGVVRKRYMPLIFSDKTSYLDFDTSITNEKGKAVGKIRGVNGNHGIGLMRVQECLEASKLVADQSIKVQISKPEWWPYEASKDWRK